MGADKSSGHSGTSFYTRIDCQTYIRSRNKTLEIAEDDMSHDNDGDKS